MRTVFGMGCTAVILGLGACTTEEPAPQTATVIVEASADESLLLIVSSRFEVVSDGRIVFTNVDTIPLTANYNETFQLNEEARFTAKLLNQHQTPEEVRLSVLLDGGVRYDELATIANGGFLQYVYRFREGNVF